MWVVALARHASTGHPGIAHFHAVMMLPLKQQPSWSHPFCHQIAVQALHQAPSALGRDAPQPSLHVLLAFRTLAHHHTGIPSLTAESKGVRSHVGAAGVKSR
eukprot:4611291-Amphidinium_carterae.2